MKNRILLIDESLTVQKVVSLTLDKGRYHVSYAKSRPEAVKLIVEDLPKLILVSDQVKDINAATFPKEVESWLGRDHNLPAIILVTSQDIREARHYTAVLKKPFTPQTLQSLVSSHLGPMTDSVVPDDFEDQRLQHAFNSAFSDEQNLVKQTFEGVDESLSDNAGNEPTQHGISPWKDPERGNVMQKTPSNHRMESPGDLWGVNPKGQGVRPPDVLNTEDSVAYKMQLENQVRTELEKQDLEAVVDRMLQKMLPPIVEKLVQDRLDKLLKEQEGFTEATS